MRRDEEQIQGGPEESTGNGEECRSPRPPAGIVVSCGVRCLRLDLLKLVNRRSGGVDEPFKGNTPRAIQAFTKPSIPVGDTSRCLTAHARLGGCSLRGMSSQLPSRE